jgi:hypothetical protein
MDRRGRDKEGARQGCGGVQGERRAERKGVHEGTGGGAVQKVAKTKSGHDVPRSVQSLGGEGTEQDRRASGRGSSGGAVGGAGRRAERVHRKLLAFATVPLDALSVLRLPGAWDAACPISTG